MRWGIYLHIPFCRQKCFYCDFPSFAGKESQMEAYTDALCQEIVVQGSLLREKRGQAAAEKVAWLQPGWPETAASTVYIGGGTPTALSVPQLEQIIQTLRQEIPLSEELEFTLEANPGTVSAEQLIRLRELGVNRLSFGVQSFSDRLLKNIGRIHTARQAIEAIDLAKAAGFQNISLDLMYGLPGQTMDDLQRSLQQAVELDVQHISIYGLQLEEGTVFARQKEQGQLELPDEEVVEQMYDYMTEELPQQGYQRYEISNFAQPGFESRHNLGYWQDIPYVGLGAAAHSYWLGQRMEHVTDPASYIERMRAGKAVVRAEEPMTREIAMEEFAFLALRTIRGIDERAFAEKFGCTLREVYAESIQRMVSKGFLAENEGFVYLTVQGMKYGNQVFEAFLL